MKDEFTDALLNNADKIILEEYDWYAPLIGDWYFDYYDNLESPQPRHVIGEWIFRKILEGSIVQDLFICPSRTERITNPQEDGEYGVALRKFNFDEKCYNMVYSTKDYMIHVNWKKECDKLVGTVQEVPDNQFIFSDITPDSFKWTNIQIQNNGTSKELSRIFAKRKK
ncbi:MAG: hypothetical protein HPZ99_07445 [Oscillospiraceae bacterium]|nr:hypothetical protein [Oscillospiraceae bacterium]